MSDHSKLRRPLREGLLRGLQTAAALGAAALLALVLYTSFVVQNNRQVQQATAAAVLQVRSTAIYATAVAQETAQVEEINNWPAQPISLPAAALTIEDAGQVQELARWGQSGPCAQVWSPDGLYLAVQGAAGVHVYDTLTWKERAYLEAPSSWCGLAFSSNGQMLAIVSSEAVRVWQWAGETPPRTLDEFPGLVYAATFATDGTLQVFGQESSGPAVWLWRDGTGVLFFLPVAGAGRVEPALSGLVPDDQLSSLALSPDGQLLAAGSSDGWVQLWRTADGLPSRAAEHSPPASGGRPGHSLREDIAPIEHLLFSPDSTLLVSLSAVPRIWRAADATLLQTLQGRPQAAAFSPDGARLLVATSDWVEAWRVESGTRLWTSPRSGFSGQLALSPDGRLLASWMEAGWAVWDVASWQPVVGESWSTIPWSRVSVSPDGQYVATTTRQGAVWLWRLADGTPLSILNATRDPLAAGPGGGLAATFSPDGTLLAAGTAGSTVSLWQVPAGTPAGDLAGPVPEQGTQVVTIAFSPDGALLAAGLSDGTVLLWRPADGTLVHTLDEFTNPEGSGLAQVIFSPDGQFLVAMSNFGDLRLWQTNDGAFLRTLEVRLFAVAAAFSPDGTTITSVGRDRAVRRRLLADGRLLEERSATRAQTWDVCAAISPDGALLAASARDNTIWLWDVASGQALRILRGHSGSVYGLAFSADGKLLISASWDGTVRLWGVTD